MTTKIDRAVGIVGIGSYVPAKSVTNKDMEAIVETSDEWISDRTGIKCRHFVAENEHTSDLATKAAERALKDANLTPDDIDLIVVATATPDMLFPSTACLIQRDGEMADAKQQLIDKLLTRIQGVIQARESKYIMMHAPTERLDEVIALLPGAERPTILPLAGDQQRVAMHMVSSETLFWETMEKLKALGASSILVLPIEKMME